VEDLKKLLPHHKTSGSKFEKTSSLFEINGIAAVQSCNNVLYFEGEGTETYMFLVRAPKGPTVKFQVHNIHTTGEVRHTGNCLLNSRPILYFENAFEQDPFLRLVKRMLYQALGTPRNHPKSQPFHDHIMCFYLVDGKIWFRHYDITPETPNDMDNPERQLLAEIGPRFVLEPIKAVNCSFYGQTIYANDDYLSPATLRTQAPLFSKNPFLKNSRIEKAKVTKYSGKKLKSPEFLEKSILKRFL